jgi:Tfp pilus assembly protein PilF
MEVGLFEESLKQLNNALKNEPKNAQIFKLKALLYEALSENENSILAWRDCIRYAKEQEIINEANIHLEYLIGF